MSATIEQLFQDELVTATTDVFSTMVFTEVHPGAPSEGDPLRSGTNVVGTIAFTGKTSGLVVFYSTIDAARQITASMLGTDAASVGDEMHDAIGELTNMIGGSFRTRIAHACNETWAISVPTVTVGSDFYTKFVSEVQRLLCPFTMGDQQIFVELIVTKRT
jgi:chemotaxis protein CheX